MTSEPASILLNARFLRQELTGVQRYGREMLVRFAGRVQVIEPQQRLSSIGGHWWEQMTLPRLCRGGLLWSPGNTGPLSVRRQVVTMHDAGTLDHPEWFSRKFALWYRFLLPRLARRVQKVLTVSEFSRQRLIETCGVGEDHVVAIPNGVDARFHPATPDELHRFREKHNLEKPYFLFLGSLEPRKNVATLLQAWSQLDWKEGELILAGAPGKVFRDQGFARLPPRTRLWGRVADEDLPALLSGAFGFIYPSLYEGFGLPAIEAMACGCPVLLSATTSLPEVGGPAFDAVTGTGSALYFNPSSSEEMVASMRTLIRMDTKTRDDLGRRALARAAGFSWDRAADRTWAVLKGESATS